jgi:hypothetical protein
MAANKRKNAGTAKPSQDAETITLCFPYEIVRWARSTARKTGTTELRVTVPLSAVILKDDRAILKDGAEIDVSGYKRDAKTRGMKAKHVCHYTKPLGDDDDE